MKHYGRENTEMSGTRENSLEEHQWLESKG